MTGRDKLEIILKRYITTMQRLQHNKHKLTLKTYLILKTKNVCTGTILQHTFCFKVMDKVERENVQTRQAMYV
jgi:hypothetical protein